MAEAVRVITCTPEELRQLVREAVRAELGNANGAADKLLTAAEVGAIVGVTARSVQNWARQGMPHVKAGADMRFERAKVIAWMEQRAVQPSVDVTKAVQQLNRMKAAGG